MSAQNPLVSQAGGRPILSSGYLQQYKVGAQGKDIIWQPLFDSVTYPSAGSTSFSFFSSPIGQGSSSSLGAGSIAKNEYDTNLDLSGILGQGNEFYQIGLEFLYFPGIDPASATPALMPGTGSVASANVGAFANDLYAIGCAGLVTEKIGTNREYIQDGPLNLFPPATRLAVSSALASIAPTTQATQENYEISYAVWSGEPYVIVPIYLGSLQKFTLTLKYQAAIPTPSQVKGRLVVRGRGYYIRQVT